MSAAFELDANIANFAYYWKTPLIELAFSDISRGE